MSSVLCNHVIVTQMHMFRKQVQATYEFLLQLAKHRATHGIALTLRITMVTARRSQTTQTDKCSEQTRLNDVQYMNTDGDTLRRNNIKHRTVYV